MNDPLRVFRAREERVAVVFGGYGRKTKHRGDVYYVCLDCQAVTVFGLVENYGYGQLYGVRIAKHGSNRYMICAQCKSGYELTKEQWEQALAISKELNRRAHVMTADQTAREALQLAREIFPADAETVATLLELETVDGRLALPAGGKVAMTPAGRFREPHGPNGSGNRVDREEIRLLVEEGCKLARFFDQRAFAPIDTAIERASSARDAEALVWIASALEQHHEEMRASPQGIHANENYREWMRLFEKYSRRCLSAADEVAAALQQEEIEEAAVSMKDNITDGTDRGVDHKSQEAGTKLAKPHDEGPPPPHVDPALVIVRERYARGEISREEFLQIRDDLDG